MIGWMCGVILRDELSCAELRQRQGTEDKSKSGTNKKIAMVWTCFIEGMMINWERDVLLWRLREPNKEIGPGIHGKRLWIILHSNLELNDAMDRHKLREMITVN